MFPIGAPCFYCELCLVVQGELYHDNKCIAKTGHVRKMPKVFNAFQKVQQKATEAAEASAHAAAVQSASAAGVVTRDEVDTSTVHAAVLAESPFATRAKITQWELYVEEREKPSADHSGSALKLQLWSVQDDKSLKLEAEQTIAEILKSKGIQLIAASADLPEMEAGWLIGFSCNGSTGLVPYDTEAGGGWFAGKDAASLCIEDASTTNRKYSFRVLSDTIGALPRLVPAEIELAWLCSGTSTRIPS